MVLEHRRYRHENFSGLKLVAFDSIGCSFESCRFDKVKIEDACFGSGRETSVYVDCSFEGARMRLPVGGYARFVRCSFRDVNLRDWFCFNVEIVNCTFSGRLKKAWFNGTVREDDRHWAGRERNEFRGNDFSRMDLIDVSFRTGIDLSLQKLPSSADYIYLPDAGAAVRGAREQVLAWEDLVLRRLGLIVLRTLGEEVEKGQKQQLLRRAEFKMKACKGVDAVVFDILRRYSTPPP